MRTLYAGSGDGALSEPKWIVDGLCGFAGCGFEWTGSTGFPVSVVAGGEVNEDAFGGDGEFAGVLRGGGGAGGWLGKGNEGCAQAGGEEVECRLVRCNSQLLSYQGWGGWPFASSSLSASARSWSRPVAFLFRMSSARPMKGIGMPPKSAIVRFGQASSKDTPSMDDLIEQTFSGEVLRRHAGHRCAELSKRKVYLFRVRGRRFNPNVKILGIARLSVQHHRIASSDHVPNAVFVEPTQQFFEVRVRTHCHPSRDERRPPFAMPRQRLRWIPDVASMRRRRSGPYL